MSNYINGAVGPNDITQNSQEEGEVERGIAPESDAPFTQSGSQNKEEMETSDSSQGFQQVPSSSFIGSNHNLFGPMVPMAPGVFPVPETADGYGGNAAVRSTVPEGEQKGKTKKKQCINGMFVIFTEE